MAFNVTAGITLSDIHDAEPGPRGAGRWNLRAGTSLLTSYTDAQLNAFLANAVPGTAQDDPVEGDQLWLFASASTTDLTPTDQRVYLYTTSWNEQEEVIDGDLLVTGTMTANRIKANTFVLGQVTDQSDAMTMAGIQFMNDKIEITDDAGNVRIRIGNLGSS